MKKRLLLVVVLSTMLTLLGCAATQPTHFYTLSALSDASNQGRFHTEKPGLSLGLGPIELPSYLDRSQIVTRTNLNKLHLAEFDQWAEPLQDNVTRVLTENLSAQLSTNNIVRYPWKRPHTMNYRVAIEVTRFDTEPSGSTSLIARWRISTGDGKKVLVVRKSHFNDPVDIQNYEAIVSGLSKNLGDLSREIVEALKLVSS